MANSKHLRLVVDNTAHAAVPTPRHVATIDELVNASRDRAGFDDLVAGLRTVFAAEKIKSPLGSAKAVARVEWPLLLSVGAETGDVPGAVRAFVHFVAVDLRKARRDYGAAVRNAGRPKTLIKQGER